jgi:branched-chain amino acid transport system substrate-binding protein
MKSNLLKTAIFPIILFIVSLLLGNCSKNPNIINIGVVGPFTGEGATYGSAMKRGIELALDEVNSKGGILNKKVIATYEDDRLTQKDGINAINKLINADNVQAIIGSAASKVTLAIAPFAEKAHVVLISSISTADTIKYSGDYIFRDVPPNKQQGITAAKFVYNDLDKTNVAVFYKNDDYGASLSSAFISAFKELGGKILVVDSYSPDATDFRDQLIKIKSKKPDVIFFPGNYQESGIILRQGKELRIKSIFVGGDGSYSPELIKIAGVAADGSYYTLMSLPPDTAKSFLKFKAAYYKKYNETPDVYSVYSYDAAMVIFKAIEKAGEYEGEKIKDELYKINYQGVTGDLKFDNYGEVNKDYSVYLVRNGSFVLFK